MIKAEFTARAFDPVVGSSSILEKKKLLSAFLYGWLLRGRMQVHFTGEQGKSLAPLVCGLWAPPFFTNAGRLLKNEWRGSLFEEECRGGWRGRAGTLLCASQAADDDDEMRSGLAFGG